MGVQFVFFVEQLALGTVLCVCVYVSVLQGSPNQSSTKEKSVDKNICELVMIWDIEELWLAMIY